MGANLQTRVHGRESFIRKAVGWALRQYSAAAPAWVVDHVEQRGDRLSGLPRREALKRLG